VNTVTDTFLGQSRIFAVRGGGQIVTVATTLVLTIPHMGSSHSRFFVNVKAFPRRSFRSASTKTRYSSKYYHDTLGPPYTLCSAISRTDIVRKITGPNTRIQFPAQVIGHVLYRGNFFALSGEPAVQWNSFPETQNHGVPE